MTDTEMLDWIQEHLDAFRHSMRDDDQMPYEMSWIDDEGVGQVTIGNNLRDCVDHSVRPHKEIK